MSANTGLCEARGIDWICERIAACRSITAVAQEIGCTDSMLVMWLNSTPERSARAREVRSWTAWMWDERAEQAIMQANDPLAFQRARELAHHYRWRASKIAPKIYGDKLEVSGDQTTTVLVSRNNGDIVDVTPKNISKDVYKQVEISKGGVLAAGGDGVEGNPTSTATHRKKHREHLPRESEEITEPKPKKKSILHEVGGMIE